MAMVCIWNPSPFVSSRVTPRELLSGFIGSMVCIEGIVTKSFRGIPGYLFRSLLGVLCIPRTLLAMLGRAEEQKRVESS
nr:hypothetical protein M569_04577 [Ipomoea trifida]